MTTTITHPLTARADAGRMEPTAVPDPEVPEIARGRRRYSAKYKVRILAEYDALPKGERGAFLRREGLYSSLVSTWRTQRDAGAMTELGKPAGRQPADPRDKEIARLRSSACQGRRRAGQGEQGHRDPGKTLGVVGSARHGQRGVTDRRDEVIDDAISQLRSIVGVRQACRAVGEDQARWYRRHRLSPTPVKPEGLPGSQPRALTEAERTEVHDTLNSRRVRRPLSADGVRDAARFGHLHVLGADHVSGPPPAMARCTSAVARQPTPPR